ncbi:hypothetical protein SEA_WEST99_61 [Mycobacterium phage West99]|uniref:DUF7423 domain-containing protein n=8 Tax=Rosebushvirus TaxID=1982900 RepID=A0A649VUQ8_9CAUD|nr:gp60 [Mycobacterium phage Rosebush]YP_655736.1 gp56 [Mycobacterium phage Qyrzula]AER47292.1 hypothetical protein HEDGEROW_61 [Mycobacterium phage Hedgerow]AUX82269.1 hypothetical protein SEA_ITSYBITSY1_61 [Mycobacterium phage ItsyBitsy1]AVR76556.1 hypothetical protein SEA_BOYLE_61 [Mycobacterium phage Boyle]QFP96255.1 hypothetical protein SEA_WEST99_61 [Mycobacterium phage West99]QGJ95662.1 hypothetical protein SEA_BROWNIE5_61 [Mycobacterium phage Brownie5]QGJ95754.1 hypothetical protein 
MRLDPQHRRSTLARMASTPPPALANISTAALCYALGMSAAKGADARTPGRVAALAEELSRRGALEQLLADLGPEQAAGLRLLIIADKGQHSARIRQRRLV